MCPKEVLVKIDKVKASFLEKSEISENQTKDKLLQLILSKINKSNQENSNAKKNSKIMKLLNEIDSLDDDNNNESESNEGLKHHLVNNFKNGYQGEQRLNNSHNDKAIKKEIHYLEKKSIPVLNKNGRLSQMNNLWNQVKSKSKNYNQTKNNKPILEI